MKSTIFVLLTFILFHPILVCSSEKEIVDEEKGQIIIKNSTGDNKGDENVTNTRTETQTNQGQTKGEGSVTDTGTGSQTNEGGAGSIVPPGAITLPGGGRPVDAQK